MTLTIDLPPELEKSLKEEAARNGKEVSVFVLQALQEKIAKTRTFDEVCAPFAQAAAASGITDAEFDSFFQEARQEVWQEKQDQGQ